MHPLRTSPRRQQGFTLVELMVAVTIGLLLLGSLSALFVNNNHAQMEIERANRQVENGRYAMQLLNGDLRNAGFYGEFDTNLMTLPTALPNPCGKDVAAMRDAIALHVQGYDDDNPLDCLSDVRDNTDIVVVRHTATCIVGAADCEPASAGGPFFQASGCDNMFELGSGNVANYFQIGILTTGFSLHKRDCGVGMGTGTAAPIRRLLTHIYFVANNSQSGDGIPTLKRAEVSTQGGVFSIDIVPLAEGIENMQIEYGMDTNADGVADLFTTTPGSALACGDETCAVVNWNNVVAVKMNLLSRTLTKSMGYTDTKSYTLGNGADGQPLVIAATRDQYKRHVFSALIALPNPAGRKPI